jgi:ubiquinone/menaquinone biosynthesis C-methylase UbiE
MNTSEFLPYEWSYQDAEQLNFEDDHFDFSIVHAGLQCCQSPHRALVEMYRVSKFGLIVFDSLDNVTARIGVHLRLGQEYAIAGVAGNEYVFGGVKNTPIPNYNYRWTKREIEKTIQSYAPIGKHKFMYFYEFRINWSRAGLTKSRLLYAVFVLVAPLVKLFTLIFPRQCNNFAFVVLKPELPGGLHPWLKQESGRIVLNTAWVKQRYR